MIYGNPPQYSALPGAPLQLSSGSDYANRAREAGVFPDGRNYEITMTGPPPEIDRQGIRAVKEDIASGAALGGAMTAGMMAMGMGDPSGMFLASGVGEMVGRKGGSAAATPFALKKVAGPVTKAGAPFWKFAGEMRHPGPGASIKERGKYYASRAGDIGRAVKAGGVLVSGVRPDNPKDVNKYLAARNLGVPIAEAFGFRFYEPGGKHALNRHEAVPPGYDPYLAGMFMSRGPSWYSADAGEIRF